MTTKKTINVSIKVDRNAMKKLQGATAALSELASASIMGLDIPTASPSSRR